MENHFAQIDVREVSAPTFCDSDRDGDLDLVVGNSDAELKYFRNYTGSYAQKTGMGFDPFEISARANLNGYITPPLPF